MQRGYGAAGRIRRARQLILHPRCQWLVTIPTTTCGLRATEVDHIKPKAHGGTDDRSNLRSLCAAHHRL
jgi:5-methylcytosine-specific restriction protein A